jgi:nicotinamide-nucleotide amidase
VNAEIIGVGTELLLGQIANTNAQRISASLAEIGIDVYRHTVVGDNLERMASAISSALGRSDAVIVTGGLGPTPDDITREGVALALGVPLVRDATLEGVVRGIFERMGRWMPETNLRQADLPKGAVPIEPEGTAPGFRVEADDKVVFALPGVPWEMAAMMGKAVVPVLRERAGAATTLSRQVLVLGLGESRTHSMISDIVETQTNPTIAYLAGKGQVRVRLTAKAGSEAEALALLEPVETRVRARLGEAAVSGNFGAVGPALGELLRGLGATVGVAESLTGGLIGAQLTETPGSSEYFLGSLVCYSDAAKRDIAGVGDEVLQGPGPVSEDAARALAEGARDKLCADLGLSATGVAGPGEEGGHPVGTIFVGASWKGRTEVQATTGYGDRDNVRGFAATAALDLGRRIVARRAT